MSAWAIVETVLHRWVRESTSIAATSVTWPANGRALPSPPSAGMSVLTDRDITISGNSEKRSAQNVEWLVTLESGPGTHSIALIGPDEDDPIATASATLPAETEIADARTALLAQVSSAFDDLTVAPSGTDAIRLTGTPDLRVFHLEMSDSLSIELIASPVKVLRLTATETVVSISFRSSTTAGDGTARLLAAAAKDGMRDFDRALRRCGYRFGAVLRDTPSYADDLTETRHVLDVQLLGHRVTERGPKPWVRKLRTTLTAGDITSTLLTHE